MAWASFASHRNATSDAGKREENAVFCSTIAVFFTNKVRNIISNITATLAGRISMPLSFDVSRLPTCRRVRGAAPACCDAMQCIASGCRAYIIADGMQRNV